MDCTDTQMVLIMEPSQSEDQLFDRGNDDEDPLADPLALPEIKTEPQEVVMPVVSIKQEINNMETDNEAGNTQSFSNFQESSVQGSGLIQALLPVVKQEPQNIDSTNEPTNTHLYSNLQEGLVQGTDAVATSNDSSTSNAYEENLGFVGQVSSRVLSKVTDNNTVKNNSHSSIQEKTDDTMINKEVSAFKNQTTEFEISSTTNKTVGTSIMDTTKSKSTSLIEEEPGEETHSKELATSKNVEQTRTPTTDLFLVTKQELSTEDASQNSDGCHDNMEMRSEFERSGVYVCIICNATFANPRELNGHITTHTSETEPFYCPVCYKAFVKKNTLFNHLCFHTGFWPYYCYWCGKGFIRKCGLRIHLHEHEQIDQKTCPVCKSSFMTVNEFEDHILNSHGFEDNDLSPESTEIASSNISPELGVSPQTTSDVVLPAQTIKSEDFSKGTDNERLSMSEDLYNQGETNPILRALITGEIQKGTNNTENHSLLKINTLTVASNELKQMQTDTVAEENTTNNLCSICNDNFRNTHDLNAHLLSHTSPVPPFACPICKKLYNRKFYLYRHLCWHSGHHYYSCAECGKGFTENKLQTVQPSSDGRNFCKLCNKSFKSMYFYKCHMLNKHTEMLPTEMMSGTQIQEQTMTPESVALPQVTPISLAPIAGGIPRPTVEPLLPGREAVHIRNPFVVQSPQASSSGSSMKKKQPAPFDQNYFCKSCKIYFKSKYYYRCHMFNKHTDMHQREMMAVPQTMTPESVTLPQKRPISLVPFSGGIPRPMLESGDLLSPLLVGREPVHIRNPFVVQSLRASSSGCSSQDQFAFLCPICKVLFSQRNILNKHLLTHTSPVCPFPCPVCHISFDEIPKLENHLLLHSGINPLGCHICGQSFPNAFSLLEHHREHAGMRLYSCHLCSMKFSQNQQLLDHIATHNMQNGGMEGSSIAIHQVSNFHIYPVPESTNLNIQIMNCESLSSSVDAANIPEDPNSQGHPEPTSDDPVSEEPALKIQIMDCESLSASVDSTNISKENDPLGQAEESDEETNIGLLEEEQISCYTVIVKDQQDLPNFSCNICNETFASRKELTRNIISHSFDQSPYYCPVCNKELSSKINLKLHICLHTEHQPYVCHICQTSFSVKKTLKYHYDNIHQHSSACELCKKSWSNEVLDCKEPPVTGRASVDPATHEDVLESNGSHRVKPTYEPCFSEFVSDNIKYFACNFCNDSFAELKDLTKHLGVKHSTSASPFSCPSCKKTIKSRFNLFRHLCLHTGYRPFSCHVCQKPFIGKASYLNHLHTHAEQFGKSKQNDAVLNILKDAQNNQMDKAANNQISNNVEQINASECNNQSIPMEETVQENQSENNQNQSGDNSSISAMTVTPTNNEEQTTPIILDDDSSDDPILISSTSSLSNRNRYNNKSSGNRVRHIHLCKRYSCRICKKSFAYEATFKMHMREKHGLETEVERDPIAIDEPTPSNSCQHRVQTIRYRKVMPSASDGDGDIFMMGKKEWKTCFTEIVTLDTNTRSYSCNYCDEILPRKLRVSHLSTHSSETEPFPCPVCYETFESKISLEKHIFEHTNINPYECKTCGKFLKKTEFKGHLCDEVERQFVCKKCKHCFSTETPLRKHTYFLHIKNDPEGLAKLESGASKVLNDNSSQKESSNSETKIPDKVSDVAAMEISAAAELKDADKRTCSDKIEDLERTEISVTSQLKVLDPLSNEMPVNSSQDKSSDDKIPDDIMDHETSESSETHLKEVDIDSIANAKSSTLRQTCVDSQRAILDDKVNEEAEISASSHFKEVDTLSDEKLEDSLDNSSQMESSNSIPHEVKNHETSEMLEATSSKKENSVSYNIPSISLDKSLQKESLDGENTIAEEVMDQETTEISETTHLLELESFPSEKQDISLDISPQKESVDDENVPEEVMDQETTEIPGKTHLLEVESFSSEKNSSLDDSPQKERLDDKNYVPDEIMNNEAMEISEVSYLNEVDPLSNLEPNISSYSSLQNDTDMESEAIQMSDLADLNKADPLSNKMLCIPSDNCSQEEILDDDRISDEVMDQETTEIPLTKHMEETIFPSCKKSNVFSGDSL